MKKTYEAPVLSVRGSAIAQTLQVMQPAGNEPPTLVWEREDNS